MTRSDLVLRAALGVAGMTLTMGLAVVVQGSNPEALTPLGCVFVLLFMGSGIYTALAVLFMLDS